MGEITILFEKTLSLNSKKVLTLIMIFFGTKYFIGKHFNQRR